MGLYVSLSRDPEGKLSVCSAEVQARNTPTVGNCQSVIECFFLVIFNKEYKITLGFTFWHEKAAQNQ